MTEARATAVNALNRLNNHPAFASVDIVTFTAFLGEDELPDYVATKAAYAVDFDAEAAVAKALGVKLVYGLVA